MCSQFAGQFADGRGQQGEHDLPVLQERSRLYVTSELRRCIDVDNQEAEKIGDLEKGTRWRSMWPSFNLNKEYFLHATVQEGVEELTL